MLTRAAVACLLLTCTLAFADDWPQWRGPTRDDVWRETGIVEHFDAATLKPKWTAPLSAGYCGPTVANGRVYVTDRVREPRSAERVHCFDAETGKPIWSHQYDCEYRIRGGYDAGPRASVLVHDGLAYSLGSMGQFICFDAATGGVKWQKDLAAEYRIRMPIWAIATSPIIDGDLIILSIGGEDEHGVVAFDGRSGQLKWHALEDQANYSAPIIITQAGQRVMVLWTADRIVGLAPQSGKLLWQYPFPHTKMPLGLATPVLVDGDKLFITGFYDGSLLLHLPTDKLAAEKVWQRRGKSEKNTDALHSIISTPMIQNGYIYGVDSYGEFRCLNLMTGDRLWQNDDITPHERWSTVHFTTNGDKTWMFTERGELIVAKLSPKGCDVISRAKIIEPTGVQLKNRDVTWAHPAYANRCIFVRNDEKLICVDLAASRAR